jgi:copper transport protein
MKGLAALALAPASRRIALVIAALFTCLLAASGQASAHAALISSEPADGTVVAAPPPVLRLTFSEPVAPLVLRLFRPDGSAVDLTDFQTRDAAVEIGLPDLPDGTSMLSWRVVSIDGHPVGGSVSFSIGAPSAERPLDAASDTSGAVRAAIWFVRTVLYFGLLFGAGGAFFLAWMAPGSRAGARFIRATLLAGLAAAPLALGLQGVDALGVELGGLLDGRTWAAGFGTSYANTVLAAVLALASGLLASGRSAGPLQKVAGAAALLGTGLALALSGHASAAQPQWLTRPAVFAHGVAAAFWIGALVPMAAALRSPDGRALAAIKRFSRAIAVFLAALVAAGVVLGVIQVVDPRKLGGTDYGLVLLAKLAIVAVLLALAALNRWRFTVPALAGDAAAGRNLRRSIKVEIVLVAAILAAVALWRFTPPPRVLIAEAATPASIHLHSAAAMADVSVMPGRMGPVAVAIYPMAADFSPMKAKEVTLVLSKADAGLEPLRRTAAEVDGVWRIDDVQIPLAGVWQIRVDVLISDFEIVKLSGEIELKP